MGRDPFTFHLASDRLRSHARAGGVILALLPLVPVGWSPSGPVFLLHELLAVSALHALLAVLPGIAGALMLASTVLTRQPASIATTTAAISVAPSLCAWTSQLRGGVSDPWLEVVPLSVPALALAIVVIHVAGEARLKRTAVALLAGATVTMLAYYSSGTGGASPAELLWQGIRDASRAPTPRSIISIMTIIPFALWPVFVVGFGWNAVLRGRSTRRLPPLVAVCGVPAMLLPAVLAALAGRQSESNAWVLLCGGIVAPTILLSLLAHSIAFLARWSPGEHEAHRAEAHRMPIAAAISLLMAAIAIPWLRSSPAQAAQDWRPGLPDDRGERLYSELVPRWNDQNAPRWAGGGGDRAPARELIATATAIDPDLGTAYTALIRGVDAGNMTQRRWTRLVADVNDASRDAGLPYYLDPAATVVSSREPAKPWFRVDPYRIARTRRCNGPGGTRFVLHVNRMTSTRGGSLGMSRDDQPFCLVLLDEIESYAAELSDLAAPSSECNRAGGSIEACQALRELAANGIVPDLIATVERHELQHQLDGAEMPLAALVVQRAPGLYAPIAEKLNRELSAYLAQMTARGTAPRLSLIRLLRLASVDPDKLDAWAATLALEALAGHSIGSSPAELIAVYAELSRLDSASLSERAARAWQLQYGGELARLACE